MLRLWVNVDSDQPPVELCGEKPAIEQWHYISTGQTARISFTTSDKTVGAQVSETEEEEKELALHGNAINYALLTGLSHRMD